MKISQINQRGVVIIIAFLTLGILLFLGYYFLSFTIAESKISKSQEISARTYYLVEAGINRAVWKLKNDTTTNDSDDPWATCFTATTTDCPDCNTWLDTFSASTDDLVPNSDIIVTIQNTACAEGQLMATSTIALSGGRTAQRVVKTKVFKASASPTKDSALFSGGASENIYLTNSYLRVYGNLFSNNNLNAKGISKIEVYKTLPADGKILVENNYLPSTYSSVSSTAICAKNICNTTTTCECLTEAGELADEFQGCTENRCPPKSIATPQVDFDSDSQYSFKSRAQDLEKGNKCQNLCNDVTCYCNGGAPCPGNKKCVLSAGEFEDLLWAAGEDGTLTLGTNSLPTITYVTGPIKLRGGRRLVVNGALVTDDNIKIGERYRWKNDQGFSQITINRPTATTASGLLTKRKIDFGLYSSFTTTIIIGVVYASDEIDVTSIPKAFKVRGGVIGRKVDLNSLWQWLNIILDNDIILYGLGYKINNKLIKVEYSPIITVEHWEETY